VLHDLHVSSHALLQQTPSTQKPDSQSFAQAHACPLTLRAPASEHFTAPLPSPGLSPPPAPPSTRASVAPPSFLLPFPGDSHAANEAHRRRTPKAERNPL